MLTLDTKQAKAADNLSQIINEAGKYVGVITRAEKLTSKNGVSGVGLSFKTDSGQTASYLDIYVSKENGEPLFGMKTVNAIMACLKLRECPVGMIDFEKWDNNAKTMVKVRAEGYPTMMGKRIGLLLQQELGTNNVNGKETSKMIVFGAFQADTELTATEVLEGKTKPERLSGMTAALMAKPIRDNRDKAVSANRSAGGFDDRQIPAGAYDDGSEIPF